MAIRPVDLQGAIFQATQAQAATRQEAATPLAQAVAGQQLAKQVEERQETVAKMDHAEGDKVHEKKESDQPDRRSKDRKRRPGEPFEAIETDAIASASADGDHLIDFSA